MATTTPNFGWPVPTSTDLVKDGATAIEALGDSIDASLLDLKGGTTGQVLAKASGTDMDFSWVAQDDSNAIQNTIVDAKGDLIGATAADTPARLAVGTNGQVLTADSTAATGLKWATASSGALTLISATACSAVSSQSVTGFSSTYNNYRIIFSGDGSVNDSVFIKLRLSSTDSSTAYYGYTNRYFSSNASQTAVYSNGTSGVEVAQSMAASCSAIDIFRPYEAKRTSIIAAGTHFNTGNNVSTSIYTSGVHNLETSYDGFTLNWFSSSFTGNIYLYGYAK
jgi:hypothetical protein